MREGRKIEAIKAIRKSYPYDLQQARQHLKAIQKRQRGTRDLTDHQQVGHAAP